jgi:hypothetical protein
LPGFHDPPAALLAPAGSYPRLLFDADAGREDVATPPSMDMSRMSFIHVFFELMIARMSFIHVFFELMIARMSFIHVFFKLMIA